VSKISKAGLRILVDYCWGQQDVLELLVAQDVLELLLDHSPHPFPYGLSILLVEPHSEHGIFAYHQSGAGKLEVPVLLGRKVVLVVLGEQLCTMISHYGLGVTALNCRLSMPSRPGLETARLRVRRSWSLGIALIFLRSHHPSHVP